MRHNKSVSVSGRMGFMTPILLFVLLFVVCCGVVAGIFLRAFVITEDAETCHAGEECREIGIRFLLHREPISL